MPVKPIPDGFHTVTPYLVVKGAASVIEFMKKAFDAKEISRHAGPDGGVAHADVLVGDSHVMLGEPMGADWPAMPAALYLYVPDVDATYKKAVAAGGTSSRPPTDEFYGDRSCGVKDAAGNQWWIATHKEDVAPAELERRMKAMKPPPGKAPATPAKK
jgi:PhnB protein